jgi:hypothetical protein
LAGVVDGVLDDAREEVGVGVGAAGDWFGEIVFGEIADVGFEQVAAVVPAGEEIVPGDGWLGPLLFGLPGGHGSGGVGVADAFVPEEEMLEESGDGIGVGSWRGDGLFWGDLREEFGQRWAVPGAFYCGGVVGIGDLLELGHRLSRRCADSERRVR